MKKMNNKFFYFILIVSIFLPIEFMSYLFINKINNHPIIIKSKNMYQKQKNNNYLDKLTKDYVDLTPYINKPEEFENYISINDINNSSYASINTFKNEYNENILIQGDSWAEFANTEKITDFLKDLTIKRNFGLYNAGKIGYSVSPMNVQLHFLRNKLNINPSIIIAIMDQTDLGDELHRYQTLNKNTLELTDTYSSYKFKKKFFNILDSKNLSFFKLLRLSKEFFISRYNQLNNDFYITCRYIISRITYLIDSVPTVISPLVYGLEKDNKKIIKYRLNNYINNVFKDNNLKKLVIVTHPHRNHLVNDKKKYKENISLMINNIISNSAHKKKILHINFNDDFDHVYKNTEIKKIFFKNDRFSHLTEQSYLNYYYPHIFSKCCN
tara:strand:- start:8687 stop:9835 length:1149 start_codon:yes stop_codon:yes gene_type:complete